MRKLALLGLIALSACETVNKWTDNSMAWANRTMPTYESLFGEEKPKSTELEAGYTQQKAVPVVPVEAVDTIPQKTTLNTQQEVYYDSSERGHSFGR